MVNRTDRSQSLLRKMVAKYRDGMADLSATTYGTELIGRLTSDLTAELSGGSLRRRIQYLRKFFSEHEIKHTCAKLRRRRYEALMIVKAFEFRADLEPQAIEEGRFIF